MLFRSLTSSMGKIMERMITERLTYYIESRGLLSSYQSGFRKGRGTMDPVVCLESDIRKAQVNREVVVAVFFDVEKAYDMVWKDGLLIKLYKMGITGRAYSWIKNFLNDRVIQVQIGVARSNKYKIDNGTPQGSIISPLLFSIMVNDVFSGLDKNIMQSLFADDGALWRRGRNVRFVYEKMQNAIKSVENWAYDWGVKFSVNKTKTVVFSRRMIEEIDLTLYGEKLEKVSKFRFLGIMFDSKLLWDDHVKYIEGKCKKVVNLMRCLTGLDWGADKVNLKKIYVALIRSVMDV